MTGSRAPSDMAGPLTAGASRSPHRRCGEIPPNRTRERARRGRAGRGGTTSCGSRSAREPPWRPGVGVLLRQPGQRDQAAIVVQPFAKPLELDGGDEPARPARRCTRRSRLRGNPARSTGRRPRRSSARRCGTSCRTACGLVHVGAERPAVAAVVEGPVAARRVQQASRRARRDRSRSPRAGPSRAGNAGRCGRCR